MSLYPNIRFIHILFLLVTLIGPLNPGAQAGVEITYIHNDALGTPIAGTDEQGNVKWRAHYQPYGEELLGEQQLFGVRAGYTGQRADPETGLTYMGARYYSTRIGRFMGVDPAGVSESNIYSFNRYAYANNNPYRFVDPNGESPVSAGLVFIARETGIGFGLGVIADSISQYAAFGEVDIQLALTSNAAIAGGEAGLFSGVVRTFVSGIAAAKGLIPNRTVSNVKDITKPGSKLPNIKTDVPKSEFEKNLLGNGFSQSTISTKKGPINIFNKGDKNFTTRNFSNSTDGPTAEVFKNNQPLSKIRLGDKQ